MPDHQTKKKGGGLHSTPSSSKIPAIQEDGTSIVSHEKSENTISQIDEDDENGLKNGEQQVAIKEDVPKPRPPKDIMRTEPVLTRLIVETYEGGEDEDGFYEGEGITHFHGGHWYKGNFKHGFMDGQGVYCWADGIMYAGEFADNRITGNGVYSWSDGSIYEGDVLDGLRHGRGTYRCGTCPSMYTGEWVQGKRHGKGILYFDEKCETYYDGEWKHGMKHGYGVHKYKSGNLYQGEWIDNIRHGQGKMNWYDKGEEYEGNWVKGVQNGNGKYTWYSKRVAISQYPIRNEYEGEFVNKMRNGYGVFYYASGAKYAGEWKNNLKHGEGEFMFKNGSVFKGMFENDHIVEFPNIIPSRMTTPEITEAGIPVRSQTPMRMPSPNAGLGSVDAVLDINLSEIFIRDKFDIEQQQQELDEITKTILRHITPIKHIYKCYSSLGNMENTDNTFVMNRIQFWRFLKDCQLHVLGYSLMQMDVACGVSEKDKDIHDPASQFYVRDFVNALVYVSYLLFKAEFNGQKPVIAKCLVKLINDKMLPNACIIKGSVFADVNKTKEAMKYIDSCNDVFLYFSELPLKKETTDKFMRMRDFLFILKELRLLNRTLSARRFIELLHSENLGVLEDRCYNLETEIVFLEFFETLVDCSQFYSLPAKLESKSSIPSTKRKVQNVLSIDSIKSPTLTKGEEEFHFEGENVTESVRSPVDAPSPDKSTTFAVETASVADQPKAEAVQSPTSKAPEGGVIERKISTASVSKKDHHGSKDGSSVGGSRGKRRGTQDHIDTENKFGSATNSSKRDKGSKEREKSKYGNKSAKKVVIEDDVATTTAAPSIVNPESEAQSVVPRVFSATDHEGSIYQSLPDKVRESVMSPGKSQISSVVVVDERQMVQDSLDGNLRDVVQQESPILPTSSQGVLSPEATMADDNNDDDNFHTWANHLSIFFDGHFFPAFKRYKIVDNALTEKIEGTNLLESS